MINPHLLPALLLALLAGLSACRGGDNSTHEHALGHGHNDSGGDEMAEGPHGGRLLQSGDFALEVTIFDGGAAPEFRLYPTLRGTPLLPDEVSVTMALTRVNGLPGGAEDRHDFQPGDGYLQSPDKVDEPHSFDVQVTAQHAGETHEWAYESPEGRVQIVADMATVSGLKTATVDGGLIREQRALYGRIRPDPVRVRTVSARFPGEVKAVSVQIGDTVTAGQTLATVESNESLRVYRVTAPIAGVVTQRSINPGESVGDAALFEVADFSQVWAELTVFPRDRAQLEAGQAVTVIATDGAGRGRGVIDYLSPTGADNQAVNARVVLANADAQWTPGQFVSAQVTVGEAQVDVMVPPSALQRFRDWDVVFVNDGDTYQAVPVVLGRRDSAAVEVTAGLESGARVVVENAFLVKADIEKSGASHDH